ncbi:hypothetical protein [uncultured Bacteroides sp.]|uniref:hypothetical protein n=1 Tax=uncultured Bacteroides sp. TaxID=162156 RepID=UPI0025D0945A|nr:hypothetical protein [uncultured Bacteroides sp.]
MTEVELENHVEVLVDIAYIAGEEGLFKDRDSRIVNRLIISWACEFARLHKDTDWSETDYLDIIYSFTGDKIEELNNNG